VFCYRFFKGVAARPSSRHQAGLRRERRIERQRAMAHVFKPVPLARGLGWEYYSERVILFCEYISNYENCLLLASALALFPTLTLAGLTMLVGRKTIGCISRPQSAGRILCTEDFIVLMV